LPLEELLVLAWDYDGSFYPGWMKKLLFKPVVVLLELVSVG
jgi:hypothetical protein